MLRFFWLLAFFEPQVMQLQGARVELEKLSGFMVESFNVFLLQLSCGLKRKHALFLGHEDWRWFREEGGRVEQEVEMRSWELNIRRRHKQIINQELQGEDCRQDKVHVCLSVWCLQIKWVRDGRINISRNIAIKQTKMTVISRNNPYITFH